MSHRKAELLKRLYEQRNQVQGCSAVLLDLWGDDSFFNGRSLDVFIPRLRRYVKDDPPVQIVNVRVLGYKLIVRRLDHSATDGNCSGLSPFSLSQ